MNSPQAKDWDLFVENHPLGNIHQTEKFKEFSSQLPQRGKSWLITTEDHTAGTVLIRYRLPRGLSWLYAPRGPLLDYQKSPETIQKQLTELHTTIKKIAKQEKAIFLRIDPPILENTQEADNFQKTAHSLKFRPVGHGFQPQHTLIIDLTLEHDQILSQMKPKGRYNIKVATKNGVVIRTSSPENKEQFQKDLIAFYDILQETTGRDGFSGHPLDYYQKMLTTLFPSATLYIAENNQGKIISAAIITYFKTTATYYYGVSSNQDRNLMSPYLLHWQVMKDAKEAGCESYDLFGIAPPASPHHPWQGVTEFKKKFGGTDQQYIPASEKPLKPLLYFLYRLYKKFR
ncbi:hypothetical protein CVV38_01125 [Candidatus Peregrinibacteria bacterium HGW-Peregrinibacteria-1]|jgi:lipid II:glycine glycyltransferase (peptidoglycan interpeptide bridge formation enzyme)|nr:MAG: hypothetical protein CVV38_01125 [Candidatus Peregrinibacteria bacterium HGW-Peregrinibacteria-1]